MTSKTVNSLLEEKPEHLSFNKPGRPVINSVNCHTSRNSEVSHDSCFVSSDVYTNNIYINIFHKEEIENVV